MALKEWNGFPTLATERLELCAIIRDHADWYLKHFSTPEIAVGQGFPPPRDLEAAKQELESYIVGLFEKGDGYRWGIRLKGDSDIIGSIGFYGWDKENERAEMGYDLRPEHWGKGIMREALERVLRYGFEEMALNRVQIRILDTNPRSMGLVSRLGFKEDGVLRQYSKIDGRYVDEHVFSRLKDEHSAGRRTAPTV